MGEDERRGGSGEDRISGLPDELLHNILVRLRSAQAAGRSSVLSRRWRHVWAHLPELRLVAPRAAAAAAASFLDTVDGALAGYLAPTLGHLSISLEQRDVSITAGRVAPWLQFAAEHRAGEIHLRVPLNPRRLFEPEEVEDEAVLELPACEGAKQIQLNLTHEWRLRLQASSLFTVLTSMKIMHGRMEGSELTSLVCTQCPCLRDLTLFLELIAGSDVWMHSSSLRSLALVVKNMWRLEVVAPKLEELALNYEPVEAHISAPKLVKVAWNADVDIQFADVGCSLQLLEATNYAVPFLTKQFDEVDELKLNIYIPRGVAGYGSFLNETNKLPKCKSFKICLARGNHALVPSVLQLLKKCSSTKKFSVTLEVSGNRASCPAPCPCCLDNIDSVALSSLEEVEINYFTYSHENMELVEFLSSNAAILKRLVIISVPPLTKEVCEKIRIMCHRNVKVKFYVIRDAKRVPFD